MQKLIFSFLCLLGFTISVQAQSISGVLFDFSFDRQYEKKDIIGWNPQRHAQASFGGRSWTAQDLDGFHSWLNQLAQEKDEKTAYKRQSVLNQWGIAHDCFDTIIALHFVYALRHGLAVKYGSYNSLHYATKPKQLIKLALKNFSTRQAAALTYEVDLNQPANFSAGLIYVYSDKIGHALYLSHFIENGLARSLEGPFPASFAKIKVGYFLRIKREHGSKPATFRRFPLFIKRGEKIISRIPKAFPAAKAHSNQRWWRCVNGKNATTKPYTRPLWENIKNFLIFNQHNKTKPTTSAKICMHNMSPMTPQKIDSYHQVAQKSLDNLCLALKERIWRVNFGLEQCLSSNDDNKCTPDSRGLYSTTAFDHRIFEQLTDIQRLLKYPSTTALYRNLTLFHCPSMDLHNKSEQAPYYLALRLTEPDDDGFILNFIFSPWLKQISNPARTISHDPRESRAQRWGCEEPQNYSCITGKRDQRQKDIPPNKNLEVAYTYFNTAEQRKILTVSGQILNSEIKHIVFFLRDKNDYHHIEIPDNQSFRVERDITDWQDMVTVFYFDSWNQLLFQEDAAF